MAVYVGTSGWTYGDWRGRFYPAPLPQREWLAYYCARFPTVELNVTTYRLPKPTDVERWNAVPDGFRYAVKLSRLITHRKRPGEPIRFVENFFAAIGPLGPRVANVLAQFPPWFARDLDVLRAFLDALPAHHRYVVEFREPSWYDESVYALLRERGVTLCVHDLRGSATPLVRVGPIVYVRLHGPVRAYAGSYSGPQLARWAAAIRALAGDEDAFVYFNNDERAFAARNAVRLTQLLAEVPR